MGVLGGKAPNYGIIVSGPEVVGPGLRVIGFPAVAEGVGIAGVGGLLVAEGVVLIDPGHRAGGICKLHHIPVAVVQVVPGDPALLGADQLKAPDILARDCRSLHLQHHIVAVQNIVGGDDARGLAGAQPRGSISIGNRVGACRNPHKLSKSIILVGHSFRNGAAGFCQLVPVRHQMLNLRLIFNYFQA